MSEPGDQSSEVRRDAEVDRGSYLIFFAIMGFVLGFLSFLCPLLILFGLPLNIAIYVAGRRDLQGMHAGKIDIRGEPATRKAIDMTINSIVFCLVAPILWLAIVVWFRWMGFHRWGGKSWS